MDSSLNSPFFSIVVPTYNRLHQAERFLSCISRLDYNPDGFEVILVDDGSEKAIESMVDGFRNKLRLTCIRQKNAGPANARHTGTLFAKGKILVFTDDDCLPSTDWLRSLENACLANPNCAVGGRTINCLHENLYSATSQLLITYLQDYYNRDWQDARYFATSNLAFPTHLYRRIGGLDLNWCLCGGEDRDLCDRWVRSGNRIVFAPEVVVYHAHNLTIDSFFRQHFNYGRGAFQFHYGRGRKVLSKIPFNPMNFYFRLLLFPFNELPFGRALKSFILLMLSQCAVALGFMHQLQLFKAKANK